MLNLDPILYIDGYKVGHKFQYHEKTENIYANFTARSNSRAKTIVPFINDEIVWVGISAELQALKNDFEVNFFDKDKHEVIAKYNRRMDSYLGPDSVDTSHIAALHDLGYLPIAVWALPEGSIVPCKVPVLTIESTNSEFAWIVNYIETILSANLWQMQTSATTAFQYRCLLEYYAEVTGSPKDFVLWQGHDFSFRGMPGVEAAARSGFGHLTSFLGTDTLPAIDYVEQYYPNGMNTYIGGSVPASEHSVASTNILFLEEKYKHKANPKLEAEKEFFNKYITKIYPSGVVSYVSDTYDFWSVLTEVAVANKEAILSRTPNHLGLAKVVFRPDSGDPELIITGYDLMGEFDDSNDFYWAHDFTLQKDKFMAVKIGDKYYQVRRNEGLGLRPALSKELTKAEVDGAVQTLWNIFGGTTNDKGYKTLNERVGLIYGDSITLDRAKTILSRLKDKGFASCNVVFGIGSFTYQYNTRDTHGFAMKTTYAMVDGREIMVYKDPKTDDGTKKSAVGRLLVTRNEDGKFVLRDGLDMNEDGLFNNENELKLVQYQTEVIRTDFADIRNRIDQEVAKRVKVLIQKG